MEKPKNISPYYCSRTRNPNDLDSVEYLESPFSVAVVGALGDQRVWLGLGKVIGVVEISTNNTTKRHPVIQLSDESSPSGTVELIGGINCDWGVETDQIQAMQDIVTNCPESIFPAHQYSLRSHYQAN